jgi:hypothetical protein
MAIILPRRRKLCPRLDELQSAGPFNAPQRASKLRKRALFLVMAARDG